MDPDEMRTRLDRIENGLTEANRVLRYKLAEARARADRLQGEWDEAWLLLRDVLRADVGEWALPVPLRADIAHHLGYAAKRRE